MKLTNEQLEEIRKPKRTLKIISGALLAGVSAAAVAILLLVDFANLKTDLVMLVALAATSAAVMYWASPIVFKVISSQIKSRNEGIMGHFEVLQSAWIARLAMIEGACFLNLIVTLLENSLITLFVAVLGVLLMLIAFPRNIKVEELLESRMASN